MKEESLLWAPAQQQLSMDRAENMDNVAVLVPDVDIISMHPSSKFGKVGRIKLKQFWVIQ